MRIQKTRLFWWWGLIFIGGCFISLNESSTTNHGIRNLPYIRFDYKIFLLAVLMFVLLATISKKAITQQKMKVDVVFLLLVFRIVLVFLPSLYVTEHYYWGNIVCYIVAAVVYFIVINRGILLENILPFAKVFAAITFVQCIILFFSSPVPYTDTLYKYYFVAPSGASNYLGCVMVVAFAILFFTHKGKKKWLWFLIGLVGVFFTKSRTSLFTYILIPILFVIVTTVRSGAISSKVLRRVGAVIVCGFLGLVLINGQIGTMLSELLDSFVRGFTSSGSDITSGRIDQFANQFLSGTNHPFLGVGFTFGNSYGSMHNFILESFYVNGFVGLIVQIALLIIILKYTKNQNKKIGWILLTIFMLSSFEKFLFTAVGEFVLWSIVGMVYNEKRLFDSIEQAS